MRSRLGFVTYHSHATHFTNSDLQLEMNDRQHGSRPRNTRPSNSCRTSIIVAIDGLPSECVSERTSHARKCRLEDDHNSARSHWNFSWLLAPRTPGPHVSLNSQNHTYSYSTIILRVPNDIAPVCICLLSILSFIAVFRCSQLGHQNTDTFGHSRSGLVFNHYSCRSWTCVRASCSPRILFARATVGRRESACPSRSGP